MRTKIALISLVLLLAGCSSPGELMCRQTGDTAPFVGKVPLEGTYGLFIAGQQQDLLDVYLHKGDPLGFQWDDDGTVKWMYAIGGQSKTRLDVTKVYEWRRLY
jgi:hypothetical protein